jgi:hypothetical protein
MPTISRPPDNTSMVESILAVRTAGRCGTTITEVRNLSFDVLAARYVTAVSCSWRSPREAGGNSPLSV